MKPETVGLMLLMVVSLTSWGKRPHPQLTYGAIDLTHTYRVEQSVRDETPQPDCRHGWTEMDDGSLRYMSCPDGPSLLEDLDELTEDDPRYEEKKAMLIGMIKESRKSKSSKR